jgi:hypothetical protein
MTVLLFGSILSAELESDVGGQALITALFAVRSMKGGEHARRLQHVLLDIICTVLLASLFPSRYSRSLSRRSGDLSLSIPLFPLRKPAQRRQYREGRLAQGSIFNGEKADLEFLLYW